MSLTAFTVSQISNYISRLFDTEPLLRPVRVQGEISQLTFKKHIYLSLSDGTNKLDCIVYSSRINDAARSLAQGDEVILTGNIQNYGPGSKYSLVVQAIETVGEGDLYKEFLKLKEKLHKEGLFDSMHKKPLPEYPKHIGVVTSDTGAAHEDITKILRKRTNITDVTIFPVLVQGPTAPASMINMLKTIEKKFKDEIDVIIIGRGGGSAEDLSCFNDEGLARAIYECSIPIISAVGHEIDTSISDFVADVRAETPTAAAQIAVKSNDELKALLDNSLREMNAVLANRLMSAEFQLEGTLDNMRRTLDERIIGYEREIEKALILLKENDPRSILSKGYALIQDSDGNAVINASKIKKGQEYTVTMSDGTATVEGK